jgi:hypothetical protein
MVLKLPSTENFIPNLENFPSPITNPQSTLDVPLLALVWNPTNWLHSHWLCYWRQTMSLPKWLLCFFPSKIPLGQRRQVNSQCYLILHYTHHNPIYLRYNNISSHMVQIKHHVCKQVSWLCHATKGVTYLD